jgi:hypothetical protein
MFWFGKKVESFFIKVQKYFPKKRIYSHIFFEEDPQYPRWAMPEPQDLLFEEKNESIIWMG